MAFFKSFQQNLPSVNISSILDSVSSRVDDLATAVSDVTYSASNQLSEQVTTIINKVQEDDEEGEEDQEALGQDGRPARKTKRRTSMLRDAWGGDSEPCGADQGSRGSHGGAAEGEHAPGQLEWEWRDGCWRVKKTEAELAEEERRKAEAREWEEKREKKRRERRERQLEREGKPRTGREEAQSDMRQTIEEEEEEANGLPPHKEEDKKKEIPEGKEEQEEEHEEEEDEECPTSPAPTKKKKSVKNKGKDAKEASKKEAKSKKKKTKRKGGKEGGESDSEEDKGPEPAVPQKTASVWNNKHKQSNEEGYSSEASSVQTNSIQRIKRDSSLNELQPPPYQDEDTPRRASRSRPGRAGRRGSSPEHCSSEASADQDTESYLNKGYDEDVPSDSTAVLGPEDGSGPHLPTAYEPEPLAKYGTLDVAFEYDSGEQWLAVTVTAATDIPALKQTGNISWQVHLVLLPTKKQRAKTGVQKGPCPVFTETFKFSRVEQEALGDYAVRFRLYSVRRMKKEKVLGEKVFYLTKLNLQGKMALPVTLEPGSELTGCGSLVSVSRSAGAVSYRSAGDSSTPEILLGLTYNAATGRLSAEVIQGSHFKNTASNKPTNTYVKLTLLDSKGKEMSKWKTSVCRGQPNPTYKETFMFQVALFQLSEVSLVVSVFCRRSSIKPRERIGGVSLGLNSTGEEQQTHWNQMKEAEGQQVSHWHTLTDT